LQFKAKIAAYTKSTVRKIAAYTVRTIDYIQQTFYIGDGKGNQFTKYDTAVKYLWEAVANKAPYGNEQIQSIVKFTTGWVAGDGANISLGDSPNAKDFLDNILFLNPLNAEFLIKIARSAMIEGQALLTFKRVKSDLLDTETYRITLLRWVDWKYELNLDTDNYTIKSVTFKNGSGEDTTLEKNEFVYIDVMNLGGNPNNYSSPLSVILQTSYNSGKAMEDWRSYNKFWGTLGMMFETKDNQGAKQVTQQMNAQSATGEKWQIGNTLAGPFKATFPEPTGNGTESMEKEVTMNARINSGASGVPIYDLGFSKEMSNRATADEVQDSINIHTAEAKNAIQNGIKELFIKIALDNNGNKDNLFIIDRKDVKVEIPFTQSQLMRIIKETYIPLLEASVIDVRFIQDMLPNVNIEGMIKRIKDAESERLENELKIINNSINSNEEEDEND
jgi:hypothetical protein